MKESKLRTAMSLALRLSLGILAVGAGAYYGWESLRILKGILALFQGFIAIGFLVVGIAYINLVRTEFLQWRREL